MVLWLGGLVSLARWEVVGHTSIGFLFVSAGCLSVMARILSNWPLRCGCYVLGNGEDWYHASRLPCASCVDPTSLRPLLKISAEDRSHCCR